MKSGRRDFLKSSAAIGAAMTGGASVFGVSAAEAQPAPAPSADAQAISRLYEEMEKAFIAGNLDGITSLAAASNFRSIGPDGSINDFQKWKSDMATDLSMTKYVDAVFTIEKATIHDNNAVVYLSKRYLGTVSAGKFDTTVSVRDILTKQGGTWNISETEIVKRTVNHIGPAIQAFGGTSFATQFRPKVEQRAGSLVQGCGDE